MSYPTVLCKVCRRAHCSVETFSVLALPSFLSRCAAVLAVTVAACSSVPASAADRLSVVASIPPVRALVQAVLGDRGTVHLLVPPGQSPHAIVLKPSDARAISGAAAVFWVGPDLETFLPRVLSSAPGSVQSVSLIETPGLILHERRDDPLWQGGDHAEADDDHQSHGHDDHGHDEEGHDPHVWLDARNARAWLPVIAEVLTDLDPAGATVYRHNAAEAEAAIHVLDSTIAAQMKALERRPFMVFHDAYRYFEERYSLRAVGAVSVSPSVPPGARHLVDLRARLEAEGVTCLVGEPQFSPRILEVLSRGTAARIATLDPLGGHDGDGLTGYVGMMQALADGIGGCLAGG